ncbi:MULTISPECIES: hypothetical protein [unclassified Streptomyces]|uniref:hypothetical protein n=1 Tax=unclassified Streptomyces TaxID=2593676 RepID=UPI003409DB18
MGTDIRGFVECRTWGPGLEIGETAWYAAIELSMLGVDTLTVGADRIGELWDEGTEWEVGTTVFRAERARRRDAVPADGIWRPVWTVMRALADVHGEHHVRLVVWFEE